MSEDINKKIKQVVEALGGEDLPDNLKSLVNLLANSSSNSKTSPSPSESAPREDKKNRESAEDTGELINKVRNVADKLNYSNDPRISLLNAVRPFLNSKRQQKLNNCVKLIQMTSLLRLMEDQENNN